MVADQVPLPQLTGSGAVEIVGRPGSGVTSTLLSFLAAPSHVAPVAFVDVRGMVSPVAAAECGCDLDRLAFVHVAGADRWSRAVAYLLDGVAAVAAEVPTSVPASELRTITARARTRHRLLALTSAKGQLASGVASARVVLLGAVWSGPHHGRGALSTRRLEARLEGKLARGAAPEGWLTLPSLSWEPAQARPLRAVR